MAWTNRWLGLALVGLLALLAQPAAVSDVPAATASSDEPASEQACPGIAQHADGLPDAEDAIDVGLAADAVTPEADACVAVAVEEPPSLDDRVDVGLK